MRALLEQFSKIEACHSKVDKEIGSARTYSADLKGGHHCSAATARWAADAIAEGGAERGPAFLRRLLAAQPAGPLVAGATLPSGGEAEARYFSHSGPPLAYSQAMRLGFSGCSSRAFSSWPRRVMPRSRANLR